MCVPVHRECSLKIVKDVHLLQGDDVSTMPYNLLQTAVACVSAVIVAHARSVHGMYKVHAGRGG